MAEAAPDELQQEIARLNETIEQLARRVERFESASQNQSAHILAMEAIMVAAARRSPVSVDRELVSRLIVAASDKDSSTLDSHARRASEIAGRLLSSADKLL